MFEFIPHSKKARRVHVQLSDTVEVEKRKATVMLGRAGSATRSYHFNIIQLILAKTIRNFNFNDNVFILREMINLKCF